MRMKVLITGGAGFIGSHLADQLLEKGHAVRVLDSLVPQVHGPGQKRPSYLDRGVELMIGDVRDREALEAALDGVDAVYHFAASVGVGQSMYRMAEYVSGNACGTATLLEALVRKPVQRLVVASSMSIYGEGLYARAGSNGHARSPRESTVEALTRPLEQLRRGQWDACDESGRSLVPISTPETKTPSLESVYALSKYDQERLCLLAHKAYDLPAVALRFFNVYGPRQALSNPYTGVLAIFASRMLNNHAPLIFEDGLQMRDFVSVHDVARACVLALERSEAVGRIINVGSGQPRTILQVATAMAQAMGKGHLFPEIAGKYRMGDVRHCFADITLAKEILGFEPRIAFSDGLAELTSWLEGQLAHDHTQNARAELEQRGLTL
jgi:dTDP-L-rhamnose 4-epimerase